MSEDKKEPTFNDSLLIHADQEIDQLRSTAVEYMAEADRKVQISAKLLGLQRKLEDRKNYVYLELREQKEAGNKGLTEAAIAAAISVDQIVVSIQGQLDKYKLADIRQGHRLEAVRMKHQALKAMTEALTTERYALKTTR